MYAYICCIVLKLSINDTRIIWYDEVLMRVKKLGGHIIKRNIYIIVCGSTF